MRTLICFLISIVIITIIAIKSISFDVNCGDYLKRAANANTVELAIENLEAALAYIEENNLTSGNTGVIYKSPADDIKFWYSNIKSSYEELKSISSDASILEKSNALMKLRESIIENGEKGEYLIRPDNISQYPNNALFLFLKILSIIVLCISPFFTKY